MIGPENLSKPVISAAIAEALEERAMSAEEALYRLSVIARGDMDNFISADGWLDLEKARELGLTPPPVWGSSSEKSIHNRVS